MNKNEYREYFQKIKKTVKLTEVAFANNCSKNNMSKFMNGDNSCISLEKLESFKKYIENLEFIESKQN